MSVSIWKWLGDSSPTTLWHHVSMVVASFITIKMGILGTLSPEILLIYLSAGGGAHVVEKVMRWKYGVLKNGETKSKPDEKESEQK